MNRLSCTRLSPSEREAVTAFSHQVRKSLGSEILSVVLFGSKARGDSREDSDTDIYILVKNKTKDTKSRIAAATADILLDHGILLSPVCFEMREERENSRLKSFFLEGVKREGIPL